MLELEIIWPAATEWAVPILFVWKMEGDLRLCVDYRRLNPLIQSDQYLITRMDECIDSSRESMLFSDLDAKSGY